MRRILADGPGESDPRAKPWSHSGRPQLVEAARMAVTVAGNVSSSRCWRVRHARVKYRSHGCDFHSALTFKKIPWPISKKSLGLRVRLAPCKCLPGPNLCSLSYTSHRQPTCAPLRHFLSLDGVTGRPAN
jgi:hypothetical protein